MAPAGAILAIPGNAFTSADQQVLRFSFANLPEPPELATRLAEA